jgi:hypothetical protein
MLVRRIKIPKQADKNSATIKTMQAIGDAIGATGKATIWIGIILRIGIKGAMQELFGMFKIMLIVGYLPLINVVFPVAANILY